MIQSFKLLLGRILERVIDFLMDGEGLSNAHGDFLEDILIVMITLSTKVSVYSIIPYSIMHMNIHIFTEEILTNYQIVIEIPVNDLPTVHFDHPDIHKAYLDGERLPQSHPSVSGLVRSSMVLPYVNFNMQLLSNNVCIFFILLLSVTKGIASRPP